MIVPSIIANTKAAEKTPPMAISKELSRDDNPVLSARRTVLSLLPLAASTLLARPPSAIAASDSSSSTTTSSTAQITDKLYFSIQGLPRENDAADTSSPPAGSSRVVIGVFGKDAPNSVKQIKQLFSKQGLPSTCRPMAERTLQKEQLEAKKVFNNCKQAESQGVVLQYSTVWRVMKDQHIDFGAVTGKFLARDYPTWGVDEPKNQLLKHDVPGVVSVVKGKEGGFGFSIYPGNSDDTARLDEDYIVIGRVLEGMDVIERINQIPVITTARGANYMSLTGATNGSESKAPNRSCRYGGPMYCNEFKPLVKLTITETGIL